MDIKYSDKLIKFEKNLSELDNFVIDFCKFLNKKNISYVIISGYVPILFGRNRASEDVDVFIEKLDYIKFKDLWEDLKENFTCLNASDSKKAYQDYLLKKTAIRFSKKNQFIPNMELKFPSVELDFLSLKERIKIDVNGKICYISPLELQIIFKLFLGSGKDLEDARYLFVLFKENLDKDLLNQLFGKLKIAESLRKYIE